MSSPQMKLSDNGELSFSDLGVTLSYDFWSENGRMNYLVRNDTDQLGVYNEGIYGTKNSVEIEEKDIIIIPAHASKKEEAILEFDEADTPLVIENRLVIVADGEDHPITSERP